MIGLLNLFSLILGLIAWILPLVTLFRDKKQHDKNWVVLSISSVSACAISLSLQIFYSYHLVQIEDWSALMDTAGAVAFVSATLVIVTIILNAINLVMNRGRTVH
ncbi:hypothetical protein [Radiobacillus deserti]|uniref:Cytochrome c oxidase subunit 4 n=1 Tax=Radiobacillus deserti TaxID=2594883 RepID=A0A516KDB5_9BACI|nr:hypothetical protein [Radiobacillus deserti]QDP39347.1 hypothetical protein FN924_03555 [Radiobacillus deserti]